MNMQRDINRPRNGHALRMSAAEVLFYGLILVLPFDDLLAIGGASITKWVGLMFFLCSLTQWQKIYGKVPRALVAVLGMVGIGFVGNLVHCKTLNMYALNEFCRPIFLWVLLLACYNLAVNGRFERIVGIMYAATLMLAVFQSFEVGENMRIFESALEGEVGERVSVLGTDPNYLAMVIAMGVLYGLARGLNLVKTHLRYRALFLLGAGIGFYAIIKTGSRGGLLALGGGLASLFFIPRKSFGARMAAGLVLACVIVAMVMVTINNPLIMARFRQQGENASFLEHIKVLREVNTAGRFLIWEGAARSIAKAPIFGYGATMQAVELARELNISSTTRVTHNMFLSVLLGAGITGLLCFMYFYVRAFKNSWSCRMQEAGVIVFAWFVVMFLAGMSLCMEVSKAFWIVMALSLAAKDVYARRQARAYPSANL